MGLEQASFNKRFKPLPEICKQKDKAIFCWMSPRILFDTPKCRYGSLPTTSQMLQPLIVPSLEILSLVKLLTAGGFWCN